MIRLWPTLPAPDLPTGGRVDLGAMLFAALTTPRTRKDAQPARRPAPERPSRPPRRRPERAPAGLVRIHFLSVDYPPMHYELMCREMGIPVSGQWVHGTTEYGGRIASFCVSARQKRWAEEVIFIQGTAVPERFGDLDPSVARRIGTREAYTPAHKWQKKTAGPVGIRGRLIDFASRFAGYNPGRGERAIDVAERTPRRMSRTRRRLPRRRR